MSLVRLVGRPQYIGPISLETVVILKTLKGSFGKEPKTQVPCHGYFCYGWLLFSPPKWVIKDDHFAHTVNTII